MGAGQGGRGQGRGQRGQQPRGNQGGQQQGSDETPTAVILVAIGCGVMGLLSLLYGLGITVLGGLVSGIGQTAGEMATTAEGQQVASEAATAGGILTILGISQIVTAVAKFIGIYGVLKARSWAFYMLAVVFGFEVLLNVLGLAGILGGGIGLVSLVIFALNAGILALLIMNQDYFGVSLGSSGGGQRAGV